MMGKGGKRDCGRSGAGRCSRGWRAAARLGVEARDRQVLPRGELLVVADEQILGRLERLMDEGERGRVRRMARCVKRRVVCGRRPAAGGELRECVLWGREVVVRRGVLGHVHLRAAELWRAADLEDVDANVGVDDLLVVGDARGREEVGPEAAEVVAGEGHLAEVHHCVRIRAHDRRTERRRGRRRRQRRRRRAGRPRGRDLGWRAWGRRRRARRRAGGRARRQRARWRARRRARRRVGRRGWRLARRRARRVRDDDRRGPTATSTAVARRAAAIAAAVAASAVVGVVALLRVAVVVDDRVVCERKA